MRLILTDIDGTIIPWGKHEVSPRMRAAFHKALDAGCVIGPATGRGHSWLAGLFGGDEACCATALATNGVQVYYQGELVCEKSLPAESLERARAIVREFPHTGLLCFDGPKPLLVEGTPEELLPIFPDYGRACVPARELPAGPVVKANVYAAGGEGRHQALVDRLNAEVPELDVDMARAGFSNIMPRGWNKGAAVEFLRTRLGVAPEDVFVFGDAGNDLPMFRVVENSVAMGNATPEAAAAARWHIGDVEDDAAADAIEALAAGEFPFTK